MLTQAGQVHAVKVCLLHRWRGFVSQWFNRKMFTLPSVLTTKYPLVKKLFKMPICISYLSSQVQKLRQDLRSPPHRHRGKVRCGVVYNNDNHFTAPVHIWKHSNANMKPEFLSFILLPYIYWLPTKCPPYSAPGSEHTVVNQRWSLPFQRL